jgi:hypothetical protein
LSSRGLVSRGWRLTNWVVRGLTPLCSLSRPAILVNERWTAIARTTLVQRTFHILLRSELSSRQEEGHWKREEGLLIARLREKRVMNWCTNGLQPPRRKPMQPPRGGALLSGTNTVRFKFRSSRSFWNPLEYPRLESIPAVFGHVVNHSLHIVQLGIGRDFI